MRKGQIFQSLCLALLLTVCACTGYAAGDVSVTDMTDRTVTLTAPASRIVALTASDCEILCALGAADRIVARGTYCDYPEAILSLPDVGSGKTTNLEQILALAPDLVVMSTMAQTDAQIEALTKAGVACAVTDADSIADVYASITLLGAVTGLDDNAAALVAGMQKAFSDIAALPGPDGDKTVYFEVSPLQYGLWTAGADTFMSELCDLLHVQNAFADVTGWAQISEEQLLARDPDYIVTITMYDGTGESPVDEIAHRPGWQNLKAVRNHAILLADANEISRPAPRLTLAAQTLYDFFHESK